MKKVLILVLALAMLLGCTAMAEGNLIGYTCMDGTNPFFVTLEGAIRGVKDTALPEEVKAELRAFHKSLGRAGK